MLDGRRAVLAVLPAVCLALGAGDSARSDEESSAALVGHWRKTTIRFEQPQDEHLVLAGDGTMTNWVVTAESRTAPISGQWQVDGKILTITVDTQITMSQPFTFYQGQLVFPNVQNRRGFWTRIDE